jgi:hypothetical protein
MTPRRFAILLNDYFVAVFVGIGGMQMYGVNAGALTNYGADLFAPPCIYFVARTGRKKMSAVRALVVVFGGCVVWELAQRYDFSGTPLAITRGAFDPLDILSYAVGLAACFALDVRWLTPRGLVPGTRIDSVKSRGAPSP